MCAGAIIHARIERLVFGAYDPRRGAVNSTAHAFETQGLNHRVSFTGGVLEQRCAVQLPAFFRARRGGLWNKPFIRAVYISIWSL